MLRAGSGLSRHRSTAIAAKEAASAALASAGVLKADGALVFATRHHAPAYPILLSTIAETLGTDRLVGCSAHGVLTDQGEIEQDAGVAVLAITGDSVGLRPLLVLYLSGREDLAAAELRMRLGRLISPKGRLLVFPDSNSLEPRLLDRMDHHLKRVPVAGGGSSGQPDGMGGPVFFKRVNVKSENQLKGVTEESVIKSILERTEVPEPSGAAG